MVTLWKEDLAKTNAKAAQSLADPMQYENLFPEMQQALQAEVALKRERASLQPAASYTSILVCAILIQHGDVIKVLFPNVASHREKCFRRISSRETWFSFSRSEKK